MKPVNEELVEDKSKDLPVSGDSIRQRFLQFYASRGHKVLPSASLVPEDPTVLLTIAGMLQFKPIFLGKVWHILKRLEYLILNFLVCVWCSFINEDCNIQLLIGHTFNNRT